MFLNGQPIIFVILTSVLPHRGLSEVLLLVALILTRTHVEVKLLYLLQGQHMGEWGGEQ